MDPNYLEYKSYYVYSVSDSCKTRIILGCMDPNSCNYDPTANVNVPTLCCYPGMCEGRDISLVCPGISNSVGFSFYPNPAHDQLSLQITTGGDNKEIKYGIFDSFGVSVLQKNIGMSSATLNQQVDVSSLKTGLYLIRVSIGETYESKMFMKN